MIILDSALKLALLVLNTNNKKGRPEKKIFDLKQETQELKRRIDEMLQVPEHYRNHDYIDELTYDINRHAEKVIDLYELKGSTKND